MKLAAVTMVYKGYDTLRRWCDHYSKIVGRSNIYIVSHGDDPEHRRIAKGCNVIGFPRDSLEKFENRRHRSLYMLCQFLNSAYDAVIKLDVDEFIFVDPKLHQTVADCLSKSDASAWFAFGFNLYARPDQTHIKDDILFSQQRDYAVASSVYSKAVIGKTDVFIGFHGARDDITNDASRMEIPKGLYLAHIRDAVGGKQGQVDSVTELSSAQHRYELAASGDGNFPNLPVVPAESELNECFEILSSGFGKFRKKRPRIYVVPRMVREQAFELPDRFIGAF